MQKYLLTCLILTAFPLFAHDNWCLDKRLDVWANYGYIRRQGIRNLRLVEDTAQIKSGPPILNIGDFQDLVQNDPSILNEFEFKNVLSTEDVTDRLGWESAIRGGVTFHGSPCASFEAFYTYYYPWTAKSRVVADGTLQFAFKDPFISFDFVNADEAIARYKSQLQGGEANWFWHVTPRRVNYFSFSWILGARLFHLKERFNMEFKKGENKSFYNIHTENRVYGPQIGAVLEVNPTCCWTWTFIIKGAGMLNDADNELKITDFNDTFVLRSYKKRRWEGSWLLEGFGQLAYHWTPWLSLHFAYEGFLLSGLALAPEQRDISGRDRRQISTGGDIIIDGLYAGLTLSF